MTDKLEPVRPMFELKGRNYLITGGAQGIGFAAARAICEMGGNIAVLDIQEQPTAEFEGLSSSYGVKTSYHQTDLTQQDSLNAGFANALESLGEQIDGCVPAAGIAIDKPFVDQTWDEFTRIQEINVRSRQGQKYRLKKVADRF
jgi:sorbose reductase